MKKKSGLLLSVFSLFIIALPGALAQSMVDNVWKKILAIGNLSFLQISDGSLVVGFTRILIAILVFAIFFALLTFMGGSSREGRSLGFLNRNQSGIVAAILAIISAVFIPANVLLAVGAGWATAVSLILIGGPVAGLWYILWNLNGWLNQEHDTRGTVFLKVLICLILFWILSAMKFHISKLGGAA